MISLLRLKEPANFHNDAAVGCLHEFMQECYGHDNFFSTMFDTPDKNFVPPLDEELFPEIIGIMQKMGGMWMGISTKMILHAVNLSMF